MGRKFHKFLKKNYSQVFSFNQDLLQIVFLILYKCKVFTGIQFCGILFTANIVTFKPQPIKPTIQYNVLYSGTCLEGPLSFYVFKMNRV